MSPTIPAKSAAFLWHLIAELDAGRDVYMMRHPAGTLGAGITPRSLRHLRRQGFIRLGPFEPMRGRRLGVTDAGRAQACPPRLAHLIDDPAQEATS